MKPTCNICLQPHADADCPTTFPKRMVTALERIVALLEKPKPAPRQPRKRATAKPAAKVQVRP